MIKTTLSLALLFASSICLAQIAPDKPENKETVPPKDTTYWKSALKAGANLTQATFSSNWKAGGVNNVAYSLLLQTHTDYIRDRATFRAEADLQYGAVKTQGLGMRKSLDKLYLDVKYGYAFAKSWSFYASGNVLSQFADGYKYVKTGTGEDSVAKTSAFFAPGYITESVGVEYKPVDYFYVRFGTGTLRQTIVQDNGVLPDKPGETKRYGVPDGKKVRNEVAFQLQASYEREVVKNINLKSRYTGFVNYEQLGDPVNWDHRLEFSVLAKVTKYISTSFSFIGIYDKDADDKIQISQQLGLGFLYTVGDLK